MAMSIIWCILTAVSVAAALTGGTVQAVSAAVFEGAAAGVHLAISLAGPILLWSALSKVMEQAGLTDRLARLMRPLLVRLFPESSRDRNTLGSICANITANLLGLGNAATPLGIEAVQQMKLHNAGSHASNEMCRFIVMNTASIQLIPATVAAVRAANGCASPFDILPAVWVTSACSVSAGLAACFLFAKAVK